MTVTDEEFIRRTCESEAYRIEAAYVRRGGIEVVDRVRLFKKIDERFTRLIFPTTAKEIDDGIVVGLICLWDRKIDGNVYAHCVSAGPGVNAQLRAVHSPLNQVKPQPGVAGDAAVVKFTAWKAAAWGKFLNEELDLGTAAASSRWLASFWKALDRMYGGGHLRE